MVKRKRTHRTKAAVRNTKKPTMLDARNRELKLENQLVAMMDELTTLRRRLNGMLNVIAEQSACRDLTALFLCEDPAAELRILLGNYEHEISAYRNLQGMEAMQRRCDALSVAIADRDNAILQLEWELKEARRGLWGGLWERLKMLVRLSPCK